MLYRPLGQTGLTVSEIGLGCASWWGMKAFPEAEAHALVHAAIDHGVTFFDTAASYSHGEAEPRLGRALAGRAKDRLVVATKAGTYHAGGGRIARDFSPAAVEASLHRSLRNLGVEAVGLLQLHGPARDELNDELLGLLQRLKTQGLARAVGLNSFDPGVIEYALALPVFDVAMVDYNVLRPEREPLIARAAAAGKGVLAGMPLAMGHTGGQVLKLRSARDLWYALRALKNHRADVVRGARFAFLNRLEGISGPEAALAYVLANPGVSCAVVGVTQMAHLLENLQASGRPLPADVLGRIRAAQG